MATSFILNLCPSKSISFNCPEYAWQRTALGVKQPEIPYKRLKVMGCLAFTIPPGHRNKLSPRSTRSVMVGYEKNSNAYRLWDLKSGRIIVLNDVVFNENNFPLRASDKQSTDELAILNNDLWDDVWDSHVSISPDVTSDVSPDEHHQSGSHEPSPQPPEPPTPPDEHTSIHPSSSSHRASRKHDWLPLGS